MAIEYVDLLMDNGEITRIECPTKFYDDLYEAIDNAMKRKDWWSPDMFDGCRAEYMGVGITRIAVPRVIGIL